MITSDSKTFDPVEAWCALQSIGLTRTSQIQTTPILNHEIPATDWIFFSSPRGAALYVKNYPIKAKKIAVYGQGTQAEIIKANYRIDFIGKTDESSSTLGRHFANQIGPEETVLFPLSDRSLKSIFKEISPKQRVEIKTYHTGLTPTQFDNSPSIILFTSPSNFESYTSVNPIDPTTLIVAIGSSTEKKIARKYKVDFVLETPTSQAFITLLESI